MLRNRNLPNHILIILALVGLVTGIGFIFLRLYTEIPEMLFVIGLFISLMVISFAMTQFFNRIIMNKLNKKRQGKVYRLADNDLKLEDATTYEENYGIVYHKTVVKTLYSLTIVNDPYMLFSEMASKNSDNTNFRKISRSIQFYIFDIKDKVLINKMIMLNHQGKNFYIAAFIHDKEKMTITHVDNVLYNDEFEEYVLKMYNFLGATNAKKS